MLLYERFEIPDGWNWLDGRPAPAKDLALDREVFAYRGTVEPQSRQATIDAALRIRDEAVKMGFVDLSNVEILTSHEFLWILTLRDAAVAPLIERFRQAGLLPNPQDAAAQHAAIQEPAVNLPPATRQCPQCHALLSSSDIFCTQCGARISPIPERKRKKRFPVRLLLVAAGVFLLVVGLAIWSYSIRPWTSGSAPLAADFSSSEQRIAAGSSGILSWKTQGASSVVIDHGIGVVEPAGAMPIKPDATTTYTLVASGGGNQITKKITVEVVPGDDRPKHEKPSPSQAAIEPSPVEPVPIQPAPVQPDTILPSRPAPASRQPAPVVSFRVNERDDATSIDENRSARLSWQTEGASSVVIDPGIGSVELSGAKLIAPTETTNYTLTAIGPGGVTVRRVLVNVASQPPALNVTVNGAPGESHIRAGGPVRICWRVDRADQVQMLWRDQVFDETGVTPPCIDQQPLKDTTYTFKATRGTQTTTVAVRIYVGRNQTSQP